MDSECMRGLGERQRMEVRQMKIKKSRGERRVEKEGGGGRY